MRYNRWRAVPEGAWRWPNFSPAEIACCGTRKLLINEPALDKLQALLCQKWLQAGPRQKAVV